MKYADEPEAYRKLLEEKLRPERIRATLAFSGLYQLTHQMIQNAVLEKVKVFFGKSILDDTWFEGTEAYDRKVMTLHKNPFKASLRWLQENGALTSEQCDRLDDIYRHRHDLAHEIGKYIVDPDFEPDAGLFLEALAILRDIHRFWTEVEVSLGSFDGYENLDFDNVVPAALTLLTTCILAYNDLLIPLATEEEGNADQ